jgi:O-antigen/teichoic acid export membrane protein
LIPHSTGSERKKLRRRAWEGVLSILFSRVVRTGEQFILVPCFLSAWGVEAYGEWLTLTAVVTFVSFTNIGLGAASASDIVMLLGAGHREKAERSFSNCVVVLFAIGVIVLLILIAIFLNVDISATAGFTSIRNSDAIAIVTYSALSLVLIFFYAPLGAIIGMSAGVGTVNLILAVAKTFEIATIGGGVLLFGSGPATVALITLIWVCIAVACQLIVIRRVAPSFRLRVSTVEFESLLRLVRPSLSYFVLFVSVNIIGVQLPRLILFSIIGAPAVAIFSVTVTYSRTIRSLAGIITNAMQVEFGRYFGSGDVRGFQSLVIRLCRVTVWAAVGSSLLLMACAGFFIPLWTNGRIPVEWPLLTLLILGACIGSLADAIMISLTSINRVGRIAIAHLGGVAVGLTFGSLFTSQFGSLAIAVGLLVPEIVVILLGRTEIARHTSGDRSIRLVELMRWPGDLIRAEFEAVMRLFSLR